MKPPTGQQAGKCNGTGGPSPVPYAVLMPAKIMQDQGFRARSGRRKARQVVPNRSICSI